MHFRCTKTMEVNKSRKYIVTLIIIYFIFYLEHILFYFVVIIYCLVEKVLKRNWHHQAFFVHSFNYIIIFVARLKNNYFWVWGSLINDVKFLKEVTKKTVYIITISLQHKNLICAPGGWCWRKYKYYCSHLPHNHLNLKLRKMCWDFLLYSDYYESKVTFYILFKNKFFLFYMILIFVLPLQYLLVLSTFTSESIFKNHFFLILKVNSV